jgi:hypothetical protein
MAGPSQPGASAANRRRFRPLGILHSPAGDASPAVVHGNLLFLPRGFDLANQNQMIVVQKIFVRKAKY